KGATSISASGVTWDVSSTQWTFKLPSSTPSGQYLLRMEHIGLHGASGTGGAQFYISCAQINVTGGGNGNPGPLVALPGAYRPNDPAIQINIYYPVVSISPGRNSERTLLMEYVFSQQATPHQAHPSGAASGLTLV